MHSSFLLIITQTLTTIIAETTTQPAPPTQWSLRQILFLLGIIAISFFMVRSTWKRVVRSQKKSQVPINQRIRQRLLLEKHYDQVNELMAALAELSRQINGQLDTRMTKLEILLDQSQTTMAKLQNLIEQANQISASQTKATEITTSTGPKISARPTIPNNDHTKMKTSEPNLQKQHMESTSIQFPSPQDKITTYVNEISALINDISDTNSLATATQATQSAGNTKALETKKQPEPKKKKKTANPKSPNTNIDNNKKNINNTKNKPKRKAPARKTENNKTKSNNSNKKSNTPSTKQNKQSQQKDHITQNTPDITNNIVPENMEVLQLFQQGLSKIEIAEKLARPVGEIELILNLIKDR